MKIEIAANSESRSFRKTIISSRTGFANWLFGSDEQIPIRARAWCGYLILVFLGSIVSLLRVPRPSWNVLWAEDGTVFIARALALHPLESLFEPYAGYMHAVPRLTSLIVVAVVPLNHIPAAITAIACLISSAVATMAIFVLRQRLPSFTVRFLIWITIVTMPVAGLEVNGSIANLHWYLLIGLFAILITRPSSNAIIALGVIFAVLAALSDPLAGLFLPLAIIRVFLIRRPRDALLPCFFIVALALQLAVTLSTHLIKGAIEPTSAGVLRAIGYRVFLGAISGQLGSMSVYQAYGITALVSATVIVLLPIFWLIFRGGQLGGLAVAATVSGIVFFLVTAWVRWIPSYDPSVTTDWGASRYSVVPIALIVIALACFAHVCVRRCPIKFIRTAVPWAMVSLFAVLAIFNFSGPPRVVVSPWPSELKEALDTCRLLAPSEHVNIPIAPEGWGVSVACEKLSL